MFSGVGSSLYKVQPDQEKLLEDLPESLPLPQPLVPI